MRFSSRAPKSDSTPNNVHHQRGTPQEGEPAATFMLVAYAAASRSSGRADQDGGGTRRAGSPPAAAPALRANSRAKLRPPPTFGPPIRFPHPCLRKRSASSLASGYGVESSRPGLRLARTMFGARALDTIRTGPQGLSDERGCRSSPHRRRPSRTIRVLFCARPGRPRCAPSALAPPALHLPLCRAARPLRDAKTLFNSST